MNQSYSCNVFLLLNCIARPIYFFFLFFHKNIFLADKFWLHRNRISMKRKQRQTEQRIELIVSPSRVTLRFLSHWNNLTFFNTSFFTHSELKICRSKQFFVKYILQKKKRRTNTFSDLLSVAKFDSYRQKIGDIFHFPFNINLAWIGSWICWLYRIND